MIQLDANGDGFGILGLEVADDIKVNTWNNALSDVADETLIKPGPLFDSVINLNDGDVVRFSGQFMDGADVCVNDSALTLDGSVTSPDFIFRFSEVSPAG